MGTINFFFACPGSGSSCPISGLNFFTSPASLEKNQIRNLSEWLAFRDKGASQLHKRRSGVPVGAGAKLYSCPQPLTTGP